MTTKRAAVTALPDPDPVGDQIPGLGHVHPALKAADDPRDVMLVAEDIHAYLGLGRTRGYEVTSSPEFAAIAYLPGRWRLADIRALLDARAARALADLSEAGDSLTNQQQVAAPETVAHPAVSILPQSPARAGRAPSRAASRRSTR